MATNWKGLQAGGVKARQKEGKEFLGMDVKTKYMTMGSWKADYTKSGAKKGASK